MKMGDFMSKVISYIPEIESGYGGYFFPNAGFIQVKNNHEEFAREFCYGSDYDILKKNESDNIFSSSQLTKEQLKLFKHWIEHYEGENIDFLVRVCFFDKVQNLYGKSIVTTDLHPYDKFWNYILMNWSLDIQTNLYYDQATNTFKEYDRGLFYQDENFEVKEELMKIKRKTSINERYKYFR